MKPLFALILLLTFFQPTISRGKEAILWPYFSYPPMFIVEKEQVSGYAADIFNIISRELPEYDHRLIDAPPKRIFDNLKNGLPYCAIGPAKTPDRERYLAYSLPVRLALPDVIVMRESDARKMGWIDSAALIDLLSNRELVMGHVRGSSSGNDIDTIIEKYGDQTQKVVLSGTNALDRLMKMLVEKRIDWLIWDPLSIQYHRVKHQSKIEIAALAIQESSSTYVYGYIVCPKNKWGKTIITKIDTVLRKEVPTDSFYGFFTPWIPDSLQTTFRKLYQDYMIDPLHPKTQ
jgi:uncharacterized protein (TIGR02285 family)